MHGYLRNPMISGAGLMILGIGNLHIRETSRQWAGNLVLLSAANGFMIHERRAAGFFQKPCELDARMKVDGSSATRCLGDFPREDKP